MAFWKQDDVNQGSCSCKVEINALKRRMIDVEGWLSGTFQCTGGVSRQSTTELSSYDINKVIKCMRRVLPYKDTCWFKITIPLHKMADIDCLNAFKWTKDYPEPFNGKPFKGEVGMFGPHFVFLDEKRNNKCLEFSMFDGDIENESKYYLEYTEP